MSLADEIRMLRERFGSHDKLAAELGTSRQRVIDWEAGAFPRDYADELIALGVPAGAVEAARRRGRAAVADDVAVLHEAVEELRAANSALLRRVTEMEGQIRTLIAARDIRSAAGGSA